MQTLHALRRLVNTKRNCACSLGFRAWVRETLKLATLTVLVTVALW